MTHSDVFTERWNNMRDSIHNRWERVTAEDIQAIEGRPDDLARVISERYVIPMEDAQQQINAWVGGNNSDPN